MMITVISKEESTSEINFLFALLNLICFNTDKNMRRKSIFGRAKENKESF